MRSMILKTFSVLAFAAVVFPVLFSFDINTFGNINALRILYYYGIGAVVFAFGYVEEQLSKVHKKLRILLRIIGCLSFGAGFLALLIGGDGPMAFALGACCVFGFFLGERAGAKNFADMYPLTALAVYIVLTIACYIFVRVAANEEINEAAAETVVAAFAIEFTAAALLLNQSGIFERANMRRETRASLPKGLTAYNAALVLGFTVTGLLLCIFRKQIAWVLEQAALIIGKAILALMSLFDAEPMEIETTGDAEIGPGLQFYEYTWYFAEAFAIISLIVIIIIFRHKIFNAIKAFFIRLGAFFSGRPEESSVRPEFIDVFENYSSGRNRRGENDNIYAARRKYKSEHDPTKKYRNGYRVLLFRIKSVNHRLSPADTVPVQAQRGSELFGESLGSVAKVYDEVRYNGTVPSESELAELDTLVDTK